MLYKDSFLKFAARYFLQFNTDFKSRTKSSFSEKARGFTLQIKQVTTV